MTVVKSIFYDVRPCLSRNAFINFIVGGRGTGKTFACKKFCIEDWFKHKRQFFYVRRYNTELELALTGFFDQLQNEGFFTDVEFRIKKDKRLTKFMIGDEVIGYACALSTALIMKSASFPHVYNLIFDEALIARGSGYHYLKNECVQFLELLESIFRLRDGRVLILSNAITVANPYYEYWNILPKIGKEFEFYRDNTILLQQVNSESFKEMKKKTKIGKLIDGTAYGDYAIDNKMLQDDGHFIAVKPYGSKFVCIVTINGLKHGVWANYKNGGYYISGYYDPSCRAIYALDTASHDDNSLLGGDVVEVLKTSYQYGLLFFESEKQKKRVLACIGYA